MEPSLISRRSLVAAAAVIPALAACSSAHQTSESAYVNFSSLSDLGRTSTHLVVGEFTKFEKVSFEESQGERRHVVLGYVSVSESTPAGVPATVVTSWRQPKGGPHEEGLDAVQLGTLYAFFSFVTSRASRTWLPDHPDLYVVTGLAVGMFAVNGDQVTMVAPGFDLPAGAPQDAVRRPQLTMGDLKAVKLRSQS